jgi:hypothetical protein
MKPTERYGEPRSLSRTARAGLALLIAAGVGVLLWSAWGYAMTPARSQVVAFTAVDDRSMLVRYQLTRRDPDQVIRCRIEAQDYNRVVVGEITDTIPAGLGTLTRTVTVPTRVTAVAAVVEDCRP